MNDNSFEKTRAVISTCDFEVSELQLNAVEAAFECVIENENAQGRYASIVLTNDEIIHQYNREYRNVDRATDVLSFPEDEGEALFAPPDGFLGDIMISVPTAERQGAQLGHSTERELAFLTVHGMLHLLGYDHIEKEDEAEMLAHQREIMAKKPLSDMK